MSETRKLALGSISEDVSIVGVGDIITGFETFVDVDRCASALARVAFFPVFDELYPKRSMQRNPSLYGSSRLMNNGRIVYDPWRHSTKMPSEMVPPKKKFYGKFKTIQATLVGEIGEGIIGGDTNKVTFNLLISADMHSSGRGSIGHVAKLMSAFKTVEYGDPFLRVEYRTLPYDTANRAATLLNDESGEVAGLVAADALQRVILAGQPSLGKRR